MSSSQRTPTVASPSLFLAPLHLRRTAASPHREDEENIHVHNAEGAPHSRLNNAPLMLNHNSFQFLSVSSFFVNLFCRSLHVVEPNGRFSVALALTTPPQLIPSF